MPPDDTPDIHEDTPADDHVDDGVDARAGDGVDGRVDDHDAGLNTPAAAPARRRPIGVIVVWALVAALVTVSVVHQGAVLPPEARAQRPLDKVGQLPSPLLRITGQVALGVQAVMKSFPGGGDQTKVLEQLSQDIDQIVREPLERVRAVPLIAEIRGKDAAIARLDKLLANPSLDPGLRRDATAMRTIYADGVKALVPADAEALVQRHHWFAHVALGHGQPGTDPHRKAAMAPALRTIAAIAVLELGGLLAAVVGLVLLIVALVWLLTGRLTSGYRRTTAAAPPPAANGQAFLEALALMLAALLGLGLIADAAWLPRMARYFLIWLMLPVTLWPLVRGVSWAQLRQGLGWHTGRGVVREMFAGVVGYLATLPVMALMMVLLVLAIKKLGVQTPPYHPIVEMADTTNVWRIVYLYVLACLWAPFMEESIFRGALYHHLRQFTRPLVSALLSGLIFAIIHPQGALGVPVIMTLGASFALIREWRGSMLASAAAHALNNFLAVTLLVMMLA